MLLFFYFVCTFDSSRNELFTFEGDNCLLDMINKLYEISDDCIAEMQQTHKIDMKPWDWSNHRNVTTCYLYDEPFDNSDKTYIWLETMIICQDNIEEQQLVNVILMRKQSI